MRSRGDVGGIRAGRPDFGRCAGKRGDAAVVGGPSAAGGDYPRHRRGVVGGVRPRRGDAGYRDRGSPRTAVGCRRSFPSHQRCQPDRRRGQRQLGGVQPGRPGAGRREPGPHRTAVGCRGAEPAESAGHRQPGQPGPLGRFQSGRPDHRHRRGRPHRTAVGSHRSPATGGAAGARRANRRDQRGGLQPGRSDAGHRELGPHGLAARPSRADAGRPHRHRERRRVQPERRHGGDRGCGRNHSVVECHRPGPPRRDGRPHRPGDRGLWWQCDFRPRVQPERADAGGRQK